MARRRVETEEALARKAAEVERLRQFVDQTSFAGDEQAVSGELSATDQHPADSSDVTEQRARDRVIRQMLDQEAEQIQEALRRKAAGLYGVCEVCGRSISPRRLAARPEATHCIDCQRRREHS